MKQNSKNLSLKAKFKAEFVIFLFSLSIFIFALSLSTLFSPLISGGVKSGLSFCFSVILPSAFPFMILSDALLFFMYFEKIKPLRRLFSRLFKINGYAISVFLAGLISGFPIGAKLARELYISGKISKNECERLIGFSNNASPAFVISGIGFGLLGSLKTGIFLYLISIASSITSGIVFSFSEKRESDSEYNFKHSYSFVDSIKSATKASVIICGFICFFSVVIDLLAKIIKNDWAMAFISSFLEIGNAAKFITSLNFPDIITLPLLAFAISFSGFSVHFQSKSLLSDTDISMKKYYIMKIFSSLISALLSFIIVFIFKIV